MSHLIKTETSLVIWLNIVTVVARSIRLLPACMRRDIYATHQLHCHCQWWSGQCRTKHAENAASVHNTCLNKIVCYLQRIFNRYQKLKKHSKNRVAFDKNWSVSYDMAKYCHNSCSKCLPFTRTHARRHPRHSSIPLSMTVRPNMQKTLLQFTTLV